MRQDIIIKGDKSIVLSVSLFDILEQLDKAEAYFWKILWLEAKGELIKGNILELEEEINNSENGYIINFPELIKFAERIDQIIEIVIIGSANIDFLRRYEADEDMKDSCDYCIELVDSSYWLISSVDSKFIALLIRNLPGVIMNDVG